MSLPVYALPSVHRLTFRAQLRAAAAERLPEQLAALKLGLQKQLAMNRLMTASIFCWGDQLFFYYECPRVKMQPEELVAPLDDLLASWPGAGAPRRWVPMMDIFHYSRPLSTAHWKRSERPIERTGRVIYLRPEMVSSYIFYHYQLQEEQPGVRGGKYGLIAQHENLLFFYMEKPDVEEEESYAGHLKTKNTPPNWGEVMDPHFAPWPDEDGERLWRPIECLFEI